MQLYHRHSGTHAASVLRVPEGLDAVASRKDDTLYLHIVNTRRSRPVRARLQVDGRVIAGGHIHEIADDPMVEVSQLNSTDVMKTLSKSLPASAVWEFPAASVSALELNLAPQQPESTPTP